ncbi:unnamed protein product [Thlaspi arvense]|uniref:Late embryogenesis abundant protein LEA-2 subgroup domain-containing protein n=1 Tax=Thlaspi arvense TaxID=13288 RepID=A0AAU9SHS3_THLAR|nr:unnamed protein product [Thlaspi arvense]
MSGFSDDKKEKPAAAMLPPEAPKTIASMETQSSSGGGGGRKGRKRNRKICICVTLLILLLIFLVILVLALTLFKPKRPITTIDSVTVERLRASVDALNFKVVVNLTLHVDLSLKNPNRVGFSYGPSSALLNYRGQLIGEAPLPASRLAPQKTQPMNLTLTLMADRLLSESQLLSDVMGGVIPLNTFVKISGKVSVLNIFKFKVQSSSSCDLIISVPNRNVTSQHFSGIICFIILLIFITALILSLTVYKPKSPIIRIQSATVQGVTSRISLPVDIHVNFTLSLQVLVKNRNSVSFKHESGKTVVLYREKQVGDVDLPAGTFPAKASSTLPCRLTLQIDKFAADLTGVMRDVLGGKIVLETKTKIPGKVKLLGIFNKKLVAISDCNITLDFPSMKVQNQECGMSTKL